MSFFGIGKSHKPMPDTELLVTIYDFGMRSVIESILRDAEIAYIIKERGGSLPVITGAPMLGSDIFVSSEDLLAAQELIAPCFEDADDEELSPESEDEI